MGEKGFTILKFWCKAIIFITPFVLGSIGYLLAGENLSQSLYSSVGLYILNFQDVECNLYVEIARWTAPVVAVSGIFLILKSAAQRMKDFIRCLFGKATVIYCEDEVKQILKKNISNSVIAEGENVYSGVRDHIIMFSDDMDNLNFYYKNEKKFENSNVYMRLEQLDSFLLKENKIKFFNETELVARNYWKERNLVKYMQEDAMRVKIAIIGFDQIGQKLLSFALMNNIYAPKQIIEYHVWGNSAAYEKLFSQIDLMNGDSVTYHGEEWAKDLNAFANYDRIIVTQEDDLELLQSLLYICADTEVDYYNKGEALLEHVFEGNKLRSFGMQNTILTQQNIMSEDLYHLGMELNYSYSNHYSEECDDIQQKELIMKELWDSLDGFTKASNLASADYHDIRLMVLKAQGKTDNSFSEEEIEWLSKAEHIRWSRFHFLNHWTYKPLEGARKDKNKRIHTYLIPYEKLTEDVKKMDWDTILRLMKFKNLEE